MKKEKSVKTDGNYPTEGILSKSLSFTDCPPETGRMVLSTSKCPNCNHNWDENCCEHCSYFEY